MKYSFRKFETELIRTQNRQRNRWSEAIIKQWKTFTPSEEKQILHREKME